MSKTYDTADLRHNVERAIRFADDNGKPVLKVEPDVLEFEIYARLAGSDAEPTLLGRFPAVQIRLGDDA
jgi:hypothetical protein